MLALICSSLQSCSRDLSSLFVVWMPFFRSPRILIMIVVGAEADYFVGTLSSHFGSLAFELSVATKGFVPPYISLDFAWHGSLLAPVQYYDEQGHTVEEREHNVARKDPMPRQTHRPRN
mmetsp:Transcript_32499/g.73021  ORF Transcript_32499/g.73021 Transcript_32499/m.73021 type:complete len:119 (-) Transcript_32499:1006-1362(-)